MVFTADIETVVRRGKSHRDFCEDDLIYHDGYNYFIGVVMDGCSDGKKSHFASSMFGKIIERCIRVELKEVLDQDIYDPKTIANRLTLQVMIAALEVFERLSLSVEEVQSTILLSVYQKSTKQLFCICFGDGYIQCNQGSVRKIFENTRFKNENGEAINNMPDYISYNIKEIIGKFMFPNNKNYGITPILHIEEINEKAMTSFSEWFYSQNNIIELSDVNDFMIASDGILTFMDKENNNLSNDAIDLLYDRENMIFGRIGNPSRLSKKLNVLDRRGVNNIDDVSIVKVLFEKNEL